MLQPNPLTGVGHTVMMPLDTITNDGALNDPQGIRQDLQQLKNGGVDGFGKPFLRVFSPFLAINAPNPDRV
jgi:hypothetical protein